MPHLLLVVDDEKAILEAVCIILEHLLGYRVQPALTGQEALELLHELADDLPDLILTDITMPVMTGLQLMEAVRSSPSYAHIPFLFISAMPTEDIQELLEGHDNATFLRKPYQMNELSAVIEQILNG